MPRDADDEVAAPGDPAGAEPKHRRRPRYAGTHPRRFEDKYKERDPENHPDTVASVLASGKTPAGSHRPICVTEILEILALQPGSIAVDATLGAGGHALAMLARLLPGGRLVGLDVDPAELQRASAGLAARGFGSGCFVAVHANMAALPQVLAAQGLDGVHGILADLGCSSMQIDDPARGFSFKRDGPLDLRMNQGKGPPASALLARIDEEALARLLRETADEPESVRIAAAVVKARSSAAILRTTDLANVVRDALPLPADAKPTLARVFQALRIAVNDEMSALQAFLAGLPSCLLSGGRVAILTFHSGEDRRVKQAFKDGLRAGTYSDVARNVVRPSREEIRSNPRASAAKLRWATRA